MFTGNALKINCEKLVNNFIELSHEEKQYLAEAEKIITSGSAEEQLNFSQNKLGQYVIYKPSLIFRLCENSAIFKDFCQNKNLPHTALWSAILKEIGYLGDEIQSVDRSESCSVFNQYVGAFLLKEFKLFQEKKKNTPTLLAYHFLDTACLLGGSDALTIRCSLNQDKIKNPTVLESEKSMALNQLNQDLSRLGNLYWTIGYLTAALISLDIGQYYDSFNQEDCWGIAAAFQKQSAENFLWAKELSLYKALPQNAKIITTMCGESGLNTFEFNGWDSVESSILAANKIKPDDNLQSTVKSNVNALLRRLAQSTKMAP